VEAWGGVRRGERGGRRVVAGAEEARTVAPVLLRLDSPCMVRGARARQQGADEVHMLCDRRAFGREHGMAA